MAYSDLQAFITRLESDNELIRVSAPVSRELELGAIVAQLAAGPAEHKPAILFENVQGSTIPILANVFGSSQRMAWALGVDDLDDLGRNLAKLIDLKQLTDIGALMGRAGELFGLVRSMGMGNRPVRNPLCQEVIVADAPSLDTLPLPTLFPQEGGPTLTQAQVIWHDPASDERRFQLLRVQRHDTQSLLIEWPSDELAALADVESLPVAVVLGGDPATIWSAAAPLPATIDPLLLAGYLRGKPVPLARGVTQAVDIPADAEIVIEGVLYPGQQAMAGPFGLPSGLYSTPGMLPLMHVTAITHRENPVLPITTLLEPIWMGKGGERLLLPLLQLVLSDVSDINLVANGAYPELTVVSLTARYPGHVQKTMYGLWGLGPLARVRVIIVVDDGIDVQDMAAVAQAVAANVRWPDDVTVTTGPVDRHHSAALRAGYGGRIGLDATTKAEQTVRNAPAVPSEALNKCVGSRWTVLGEYMLAVAPAHVDGTLDALARDLRSIAPDHHLLILDPDVNLDDHSTVLKRVLGNVDWRRDILIESKPGSPREGQQQFDLCGRVTIDATSKTNHHPATQRPTERLSVDEATYAQVVRRWSEYGLE